MRHCYIPCLVLLITGSCNNDIKDKGAETTEVLRFEKDLFSSDADWQTLEKKYGEFVALYAGQVIGLQADSMLSTELKKYINDKYIREVYEETQRRYADVSFIETGLGDAILNYKKLFPGKRIPQVLTFIAPFNYNTIATDSILGIGLDMFLGEDYKYYPSAGFPVYKIRKLRKEYIIRDAMMAWVESDYDKEVPDNTLLNNMISEGKMIFLAHLLMPDENDTIITGFTVQQLKWCKENEKNIWQFFIENKLLFNKNPSEFIKFMNDGPGTNGFPEEAPSKLGVFIGWKIVEAYAKKTGVSPLQLMEMSDGNKLLIESGYKPAR